MEFDIHHLCSVHAAQLHDSITRVFPVNHPINPGKEATGSYNQLSVGLFPHRYHNLNNTGYRLHAFFRVARNLAFR